MAARGYQNAHSSDRQRQYARSNPHFRNIAALSPNQIQHLVATLTASPEESHKQTA